MPISPPTPLFEEARGTLLEVVMETDTYEPRIINAHAVVQHLLDCAGNSTLLVGARPAFMLAEDFRDWAYQAAPAIAELDDESCPPSCDGNCKNYTDPVNITRDHLHSQALYTVNEVLHELQNQGGAEWLLECVVDQPDNGTLADERKVQARCALSCGTLNAAILTLANGPQRA